MLNSPGAVSAQQSLLIGNGSAITLDSGDDSIGSQLKVATNSTLNVSQADGLATGLTLDGAFVGAFDIDATSVMNLQLGDTPDGAWIFRWKDQSGGNWISTLSDWIAAGRVTVSSPHGYSITDDGMYTSIGYAAVPEPSTFALIAAAAAFAGFAVSRRRRPSPRRPRSGHSLMVGIPPD